MHIRGPRSSADRASHYGREPAGYFEAETDAIVFLFIRPHLVAVSSHNKHSLQLLNSDCLLVAIEVITRRGF